MEEQKNINKINNFDCSDDSCDSDYSDKTDDSEILNFTDNDINKINIQITNKSIYAIYCEYLQNNKLLLNPEYQRDICWSNDKMNVLIDTIMKSWIIPNFVIYKLTNNESKNNDHSYECIDGQHRLLTLKMFIENKQDPRTCRYIYWKNKNEYINERVYYDMPLDFLNQIKNKRKTKIIFRNFTKEEKNLFNDYEMSFHMLSSLNTSGIDIITKCNIFNRLQNGEKIASYEKLKNHNNIFSNCIRAHKLLKYINDIKFTSKLNIKKMKHYESFTIYFIIRTFIIIDKKNLDINFLDFNIKKYIEANDGKGAPIVQLKNDINDLIINVKEILEFIISNENIKYILPELAYIYVCIYANYGINTLTNYINSDIKIKHDKKCNDIKTYKISNGNVTSSKNINKIYNLICDDLNLL
jgi:hypothetical protein